MALIGLHEAAVAACKNEDSRIMLSSLVETMVNGYIKRHGRSVQVSIRERGSEVLYGEDDIEATMKANSYAAEFSLVKALTQPMEIDDNLELTIRSGSNYCGRVRFRCNNAHFDADDHLDAVLAVVSGHEDDSLEDIISELPISQDTAVVFAVMCSSEPYKDEDPDVRLREMITLSDSFLKGRSISSFWYSPYGFINGKLHSAGSASPYGIEEIFWHLTSIAARSRYNYLDKQIKESEKTIRRRASIFQKNSYRRGKELQLARETYSLAVRDIFAAEQLLALTEGKPLYHEEITKE